MNFETTDEQQQLRDSLQRLLAREYAFTERRRLLEEGPGWSPDVWRKLCDLGVSGLGVPQALGGLDGDARDRLGVLVELGRVLSLEPYLGSVVLAGGLAQAIGGEFAATALPGVCSGERRMAVAHAEAGARHAPCWVATRASRQGAAWQLHGEKVHVLHGAQAHDLLVSARLSGAPDEPRGLGIFRVQPDAPGVTLDAITLVDRSPAARVGLKGVAAELLAEGPAAVRALAAMRRAGMAAACAEGLGVMQGAFDLTVAYVAERRQFGSPIGTYQAVRHRVAEMKVALETVSSAAMAAAWAVSGADCDADEDGIETELSRAKLLLGRHGAMVTQQAIQLHGGIGMTQEYAVGHYLRRLTVLDQLFGDAPHHAASLGRRLRAAA